MIIRVFPSSYPTLHHYHPLQVCCSYSLYFPEAIGSANQRDNRLHTIRESRFSTDEFTRWLTCLYSVSLPTWTWRMYVIGSPLIGGMLSHMTCQEPSLRCSTLGAGEDKIRGYTLRDTVKTAGMVGGVTIPLGTGGEALAVLKVQVSEKRPSPAGLTARMRKP